VIGKGKRGCIGRLEADLLARPKLGTRNIEHRRIEIGRRQLRAVRQCVTKIPGHNARAGGGFEHPRRTGGGGAFRDIGRIPGEDDRAEALIVMLRDIASEAGCVAAHCRPPITPGGKHIPRPPGATARSSTLDWVRVRR
jgi:hypothetical protein